MHEMWGRDLVEEEDVDIDGDDNETTPSPIRSHSFSLHSSDTSVDDDDDDAVDEDDDNRNGARIARLILNGRQGVRGGRIQLNERHHLNGAAAANNANANHANRGMGQMWATLFPLRRQRQRPVVITTIMTGRTATTANSSSTVKTPSKSWRVAQKAVSTMTFPFYWAHDSFHAAVDQVADSILHYGRNLQSEFAKSSPHIDTAYFSSTLDTLWYMACILSAVHLLGLLFLAQYSINIDSVDRWGTYTSLIAMAMATLPTMTAPGVLSRCHASASLIFAGAVGAMLLVDQNVMVPLSFSKDTAATAGAVDMLDSVDLEKALQWLALSFLCLLPHTLGSTSSSAGNLALFVTGLFVSVAGHLMGALPFWLASTTESSLLQLLPQIPAGTSLIAFWTGIFILNAPALVQSYPNSESVIAKFWGYRRVLLSLLCGPGMVTYVALTVHAGQVPLGSTNMGINDFVAQFETTRTASSDSRSVTSSPIRVSASALLTTNTTNGWSKTPISQEQQLQPQTAPAVFTPVLSIPTISSLWTSMAWTSTSISTMDVTTATPHTLSPPPPAPAPPSFLDTPHASSKRQSLETTLALPITEELLVGQWN